MHSVVEVNIGCAGRVIGYEGSGAGAEEGVACRIVLGIVCFGLDDFSGDTVICECAADQVAGAFQRCPLEKCAVDHSPVG